MVGQSHFRLRVFRATTEFLPWLDCSWRPQVYLSAQPKPEASGTEVRFSRLRLRTAIGPSRPCTIFLAVAATAVRMQSSLPMPREIYMAQPKGAAKATGAPSLDSR